MTDSSHPAMHPAGSIHASTADGPHFVPVGWEEADRGLCPCGEAVRWDESTALWIPERTLVVFVLTADEAAHLRHDALMIEDLEPMLDLQLALNEDPNAEPDDGQVLIAGILYDAETLEEAVDEDDDLEDVVIPSVIDFGTGQVIEIAPMTALEARAQDGDR